VTTQSGGNPRPVRIAAVQPPISERGVEATDLARTVEEALTLTRHAISDLNANLVVLPELLNVFGQGQAEAWASAADADQFLGQFPELCADSDAWIVVPVLERRDDRYFNASVVLGPGGRRVGQYDKTHLALAEHEWYAVTAGDTYPVFDAPWGRFGIMTCYDAYFPEVARIYGGLGADVICYPSWQSGPSEQWFEVQMRSRAMDNFVIVARSSFGYEPGVAWKPGMFFGRSSILDRDGSIVSDAGHFTGVAFAELDLDRSVRMDILDDGGNVQDLRELVFATRRPETYGEIMRAWRSPIDAHAVFQRGATRP
jgi:predicted amidohydrolase